MSNATKKSNRGSILRSAQDLLWTWNPGSEKELFTMPELIKEFSIERVQKAGAVFNVEKLDWLNGLYIREKSAL